jgi:hypothetical protein
MTGQIRIRLLFDPAPSGRPFTIRWATADTNTGAVFDVRYRRNGGEWKAWKTDTRAKRGIFGKDNKPVRIRAGDVIDIQGPVPEERQPARPRQQVVPALPGGRHHLARDQRRLRETARWSWALFMDDRPRMPRRLASL